MDRFPIFKRYNSKRFPVQFFNISPEPMPSVLLRIMPDWMRHDLETPGRIKVGTFAKDLLTKVCGSLHPAPYSLSTHVSFDPRFIQPIIPQGGGTKLAGSGFGREIVHVPLSIGERPLLEAA